MRVVSVKARGWARAGKSPCARATDGMTLSGAGTESALALESTRHAVAQDVPGTASGVLVLGSCFGSLFWVLAVGSGRGFWPWAPAVGSGLGRRSGSDFARVSNAAAWRMALSSTRASPTRYAVPVIAVMACRQGASGRVGARGSPVFLFSFRP